MLDFLSRLYTLMGPVWAAGLAGAWAAAIVLLLRLILKNRVPRQVLCLLWLVVFARMALPFSFQSPVSLVPSRVTEDIPARVEQFTGRIDPLPEGGQTVLTPDQLVKPSQTGPQTQTGVTAPDLPSAPAPRQFPLRAVTAGVWLAGTAVLLGYALISYLRLKMKLACAIRTKYGAWEHPYVGSPFILGVLCPRIYVPVGVDDDARRFILCHERAHLERGDHIVKPLCWLILAVHWYNPAAWLAFLLLSRDMEAACDERVLRELGENVKADYSSTLLALAAAGRFPAPSPLAFDEGDAKSRIKNVLRYHRPAVTAVIVGVIAVVVAAACLLTSPVRADTPEDGGLPENTAPTTDLSDILDADQLAVYRQAEELYLRLFGGDTSGVNTGDGDHDTFDQGDYTYTSAIGEYADWSVFDAAVHARFTDRFWTERNTIPFYVQHNGRTYYIDAAYGDDQYDDTVPEQYALVSETADSIEFTDRGHYTDLDGSGYYLTFTVRMVLTEDGWRVDEMRSPRSASDAGEAREDQLAAPEDSPRQLLLDNLGAGPGDGNGVNGNIWLANGSGPAPISFVAGESSQAVRSLVASYDWEAVALPEGSAAIGSRLYSLSLNSLDAPYQIWFFAGKDVIQAFPTARDGSDILYFRADGAENLCEKLIAISADPVAQASLVNCPAQGTAEATAQRFMEEYFSVMKSNGHITDSELISLDMGSNFFEVSFRLKAAQPEAVFGLQEYLSGPSGWTETLNWQICLHPVEEDGIYRLYWLEAVPQPNPEPQGGRQVIEAFFDRFAQGDIEGMKQYCTEDFSNYFREDSAMGIYRAKLLSAEWSELLGAFFVTVEFDPTPDSALAGEDTTSFFLGGHPDAAGNWHINSLFTG